MNSGQQWKTGNPLGSCQKAKPPLSQPFVVPLQDGQVSFLLRNRPFLAAKDKAGRSQKQNLSLKVVFMNICYSLHFFLFPKEFHKYLKHHIVCSTPF